MDATAPNPAETVLDHTWFPDNVDFSRNIFGFVQTDRQTLSRQTFLDSRWDHTSLLRVDSPIPVVIAATEHQPRPRVNFIWHTAFCCSTLLSRCLDVPGINLALKEPQILIQLAEAKRAHQLTRHGAALDAAFKVLARPRAHDERVLLKPSNATNTLLPEALRATDGKMAFLYSDCKSFVISIAKKGEMGRIFARKLFGLFAADGHPQAKWPPQDLFELSDLQVAALVWHMQIAQFRSASVQLRSAALDCAAFLASPATVLASLNRFFELSLSQEKIDEIADGPLLSQNAKNQSEPFNAERRANEAAAIAKALGGELDTVVEWSYRACPETPRGDPLGRTLEGAS